MKVNRRAAGILAALSISSSLLSGCHDSTVYVMNEETKPVTLRFFGFKVGETKVEEIESILNQYMDQNKDMIIVYEGIGTDYGSVLADRIESGHADDLFMISPTTLTAYGKRGWFGTKITDLSGEAFIQRYSPMIQKLITVDGKIPAVPMCLSAVGLMGNMDILENCGIHEMPRTYGAWVQAMEVVQEQGYTPMVNYLGNDASLMFLIAARSAAIYRESGESQSGLSAADVYAKSITDLYGVVDRGLIDREQLAGAAEPKAYQTVLKEEFAAGKAAFAVIPSWGLASFLGGSPDFTYQYAGIPAGDEGPLTGVRASVLVGVNREGEHTAEAEAFLDYLIQPENIENYAEDQISLSPLKGAKTENPLFTELLAQIEKEQMFSDADPRIPFDMVMLLNRTSEQMAEGEPLERILEDFNAGAKWN